MEKKNKEVKILVICMVLSIVISGTASAATMFADKVDYRTGRGPHGVHAADFDGDEDMDVITTNSDSSTFSYFANKGNGTFSRKVDYITGESPRGIYAADFDGDGDLDVVTTDSDSNTFSYFANRGDGTFSAKVDYGTGWAPWEIYATDFDGDGDIDVVVTNLISLSNAWSYSYFANRGDGTFSAKVDYETDESPSGIYGADFDGDGDQDVVVTNKGSHTFSYFANDGDGTFSVKEDYRTGTNPNGVCAMDFDGDGDVDVVTANSNYVHGGVSYFENYGDGVFSPRTDYKVKEGRCPYFICAADFDDDGDNDVIITNAGGFGFKQQLLSYFANKGDGTFAEPVEYETGEEPYGVCAADFDGDNDIDVVTANAYANTFSYFENCNNGGDKLMEGDVNCDGCVSLKDSTAIKFALVGEKDLTADQIECADTNDDGEVSLKDSTLIRKWLVDPSTKLWQSPEDDDMEKPVAC